MITDKLYEVDEEHKKDSLEIVHDVPNGRIITIFLQVGGTNKTYWVDMELIGDGFYQTINRPQQKAIDSVLDAVVKQTNALRMSDVMHFTDECRSYIKLVHGITLRKD